MTILTNEALERRRARKRKNTQAWRLKEHQLMESLRQQVEALERQLRKDAEVRTTDLVPRSSELEALRQQETMLTQQNAKLREALARRQALFALPTQLPPFRLADPRLYDNVFLLHQVEATLQCLSETVPPALAHAHPEMLRGWSTKHACNGGLVYVDATCSLGPDASTDMQSACDAHWEVFNDKELYSQMNAHALDYKVIHRAHDDMLVACSTILFPDNVLVTRYMILYKIRFRDGFHSCCMSFAPDLSEITTCTLMKYAIVHGSVVAQALSRSSVPRHLDSTILVPRMIEQLSKWLDQISPRVDHNTEFTVAL
ncbi:hypothetical protein SDRG_10938 [Saprolegnia diclina VS20]|uniref:BZIP domain-containing protein n=1 Tax=Saprolegnia diclina (strain VS20) TaxID=1156394 RepID=T0Q9L3_SAPDV|nr:hypothetical protein SDRG_10938 [Saprolegnia diclina VS20]EQC31336.1 hypothetical protein SDRG_10938 [Saprolegnia diclina VS20]|eukprot:XP_008615177.1 hypothetical protein SDRG_10938 [Saprolegnia diclina VS20]